MNQEWLKYDWLEVAILCGPLQSKSLSWVADGGYGLQIWKTVANILNKQLRKADQEWFSSLGVGREANFSSP
jgi:hypothetical protein